MYSSMYSSSNPHPGHFSILRGCHRFSISSRFKSLFINHCVNRWNNWSCMYFLRPNVIGFLDNPYQRQGFSGLFFIMSQLVTTLGLPHNPVQSQGLFGYFCTMSQVATQGFQDKQSQSQGLFGYFCTMSQVATLGLILRQHQSQGLSGLFCTMSHVMLRFPLNSLQFQGLSGLFCTISHVMFGL